MPPCFRADRCYRSRRLDRDPEITNLVNTRELWFKDSIYLGFGLEGISGPSSRAAVMGRAMGYLLR